MDGFVNNLRRLAADPRNVIAANNLYDVHYIRFFTGSTSSSSSPVAARLTRSTHTHTHYRTRTRSTHYRTRTRTRTRTTRYEQQEYKTWSSYRRIAAM
jgi:hypothetical protein